MLPNPDCLGGIYDGGLVEDDTNSARRGENFVSTILEQTICELDEAVMTNVLANVIVIEVCENCNYDRRNRR